VSGRIKVLLADESAAVRLLLSALLRDDERFEVLGDVATGAETIERCGDADLVVVDLVLADTDAFTLIDRLRAERPALPVVLYADVDPPYLRSEAAARGVAGFFTHHMDATTVLDGFAAVAIATGGPQP
jgi:DNA-binding NarL/FixJ family response regulator